MKELSIEEKAKAYDEVRKKIAIRFGSNVAKEIFSQFEMSKDERIREAIIKFFELQDDNTTYSLIPKKDILVWLEKQGEQNTVEEKPYPETLEKAIELYYFSYGNGKGGFDNLSLEKFKDIVKTFVNDYGEQKPAEHKEIPTDIRSIVDKEANAIWKEINTGHNHSIIDTFNQFYGMCMQVAEAVMEYNKPAEWSEEDESFLDFVIELVENYIDDEDSGDMSYEEHRAFYMKYIDWLKSLKDRYTWKPSDKQMEVLVWCKPLFADPKSKGILESLINDLKKLRKE